MRRKAGSPFRTGSRSSCGTGHMPWGCCRTARVEGGRPVRRGPHAGGPGGSPTAALGGAQLAINRHTENPERPGRSSTSSPVRNRCGSGPGSWVSFPRGWRSTRETNWPGIFASPQQRRDGSSSMPFPDRSLRCITSSRRSSRSTCTAPLPGKRPQLALSQAQTEMQNLLNRVGLGARASTARR